MAHETLPFTLDLDNQNWQPIFGNQELETFFMIYLKIHSIEPKEPENPNTKYIYTISYKIQNFRGAISIGFTSFPKITFHPQTTDPTIDCDIFIKLAPFSNKFCYTNKRVLYRSRLEKGYTIDTNAILGDIPSSLAGTNLKKVKYLDPREYQRNGDDIDAVITISEEKRLETLNKIDTFSRQELKCELENLLEKDSIAGRNGICCPKWTIVK